MRPSAAYRRVSLRMDDETLTRGGLGASAPRPTANGVDCIDPASR